MRNCTAPFFITLFALGGCGGAAGLGDDASSGQQLTGWSCNGLTGTTQSPTGRYAVTAFGCWVDDSGNDRGDPGDNCVPSCLDSTGLPNLCDGLSGPDCERSLNWFSADADRFGCGTKLRVTNPETGVAAVLAVIDRGPNCRIEDKIHGWVLDSSYPTNNLLFGGEQSATDRAMVSVEVVDASTPLGPVK
jgi:hypothetical protein